MLSDDEPFAASVGRSVALNRYDVGWSHFNHQPDVPIASQFRVKNCKEVSRPDVSVGDRAFSPVSHHVFGPLALAPISDKARGRIVAFAAYIVQQIGSERGAPRGRKVDVNVG